MVVYSTNGSDKRLTFTFFECDNMLLPLTVTAISLREPEIPVSDERISGKNPARPISGFSLIEKAMVLLIVGSLMSGVLLAIGNSTENTRRITARNQIRQLEEALYAYAQIRGYLPCPASGTSPGQELPATPLAGVACTVHPAATVGVPGAVNADGLLLDTWQNPYRYSVTNYGTDDFTVPSALKNTYSTYTNAPLMTVCQQAACAPTDVISTVAAAVILSMGPNWVAYTSADEIANASDGSTQVNGYNVSGTTTFVSATYSEANFDDQITWISPFALFGKLISAGTLP